jgi:hypothetical protein
MPDILGHYLYSITTEELHGLESIEINGQGWPLPKHPFQTSKEGCATCLVLFLHSAHAKDLLTDTKF